MGFEKRQVKVVIAGKEYLVEVGDLDAAPLIATVGDQQFEVSVEVVQPQGTSSAPVAVTSKPVAAPAAPVASVAPAASVESAANAITAPMPGDITDVYVSPGDSIGVGQEICSLEAMKMKNAIRSPRDGVVARVAVSPGQAVAHGEVLITFE